ncbi:hypothetical protein A1704_13120 [Chryseobacterium cucumeris]|uniref:hypothetical protein n=1 Tax=Chryseobacterium cucumeris TaxID=1813611 RepID=UPI000787EDDD|nr:hypothetical protein [Chryseobacterium cucumeris]KYH05100.1 hypothetical protein A1704_13120 [Chryseobacterium cucumeris]
MKKIVSIIIITASGIFNAQVALGKTTLESASSSIEFGNENRGIVLPWVTDTSGIQNVVNGTLIFDISDMKVKVYQNNLWKDLSVDTTGNADTSLQDNLTDQPEAKVSVGTPSSVSGILVLEDSNKAMILPKVTSPHLNIISPAAGMMVYDTQKKQLAVFNGTVWSFWGE